MKAASPGSDWKSQPPFLTRWWIWQAGLTSTWHPRPSWPHGLCCLRLVPRAQEPSLAPSLAGDSGPPGRPPEVLRRELPSPGQSPTQALQRPTQDITEVLSPPQREAGLGVWEPTAPFPCSPRSHRVGHCEDTHGSPVTAERRVPCEHEFSKGRGRGGPRNAEVVEALCPSRDRPTRTGEVGGAMWTGSLISGPSWAGTVWAPGCPTAPSPV